MQPPSDNTHMYNLHAPISVWLNCFFVITFRPSHIRLHCVSIFFSRPNRALIYYLYGAYIVNEGWFHLHFDDKATFFVFAIFSRHHFAHVLAILRQNGTHTMWVSNFQVIRDSICNYCIREHIIINLEIKNPKKLLIFFHLSFSLRKVDSNWKSVMIFLFINFKLIMKNWFIKHNWIIGNRLVDRSFETKMRWTNYRRFIRSPTILCKCQQESKVQKTTEINKNLFQSNFHKLMKKKWRKLWWICFAFDFWIINWELFCIPWICFSFSHVLIDGCFTKCNE